MTWLAAAGAAVIAGVCLACGPGPGEPERTQETTQAIFGGEFDNDAQQIPAVVVLMIGGGGGRAGEVCSASLVTPNMILTARHCVSRVIGMGVVCDEHGESVTGPNLGGDVDPSTLHVFTGWQPDFSTEPQANGRQIFHTASDVVCNGDVALVVLDRPIMDIVPLAVRLTASTRAGETVRVVGYGVNDITKKNGSRARKDQVPVLAVGPQVSSYETPLASRELELGLSSCLGDSGSPAISDATGAIVGVASRYYSCTDDNGHVYTTLSTLGSLFEEASAAAGTQPADEPPPVVRLVAGGGCSIAGPHAPGESDFDGSVAHAGLFAIGAIAWRRSRRPRRRKIQPSSPAASECTTHGHTRSLKRLA